MLKNGTFSYNLSKNNSRSRKPYGTWRCNICDLIFETRAEKQKHNRKYHPIEKNSSWNKGLTKEKDRRVMNQSLALKKRYKNGEIINSNKGKKKSDEIKMKISESMKKYYSENPDKIPYLLHHSSKESYPEKYFNDLFIKEGIVGYKREFFVLGYFLDFAFENIKLDIEIDGSQHWLDKRIVEHDKKRTEKLLNNGWRVIRIRWDEWQLKSFDERKELIENLKKEFLS